MAEVIGFVGLGNMGGPMAARLVASGYELHVFDIDDGAVESLVSLGASRADSAADCAAKADILLTSLPRPDHVQAVMVEGGALAAMGDGDLWVDLTTNRVEFVAELAERAPTGVQVVDCPVTGAVDGARNGKLTLFAGGSDSDLDRVVPILENLGRVIRCGALGSGNVTKLVTNQLWFVHAAAIGEGFALGMANGVALDVLWDAITDSVGDSFVARHDAPSIFAGHYDPSFPLDLCMKDLGLTMELANNVGTDLPMTERAAETFGRATERYGSAAGELHVAKRLEDDANLSFRLDGDWVPPWQA
ncbi:MAG: NAD(P)-dependent oxidoreductase [Acidimicrobiales bacterium]